MNQFIKPDTERADLLLAVIENPDNDIHRLDFAEYLSTIGESTRAEFIRASIALAHCKGPSLKYVEVSDDVPLGHEGWLLPYASSSTVKRPVMPDQQNGDDGKMPVFTILVQERQAKFNSAARYLAMKAKDESTQRKLAQIDKVNNPVKVGQRVCLHAPVAIGTPGQYFTFTVLSVEVLDHRSIPPRQRTDGLIEVQLVPEPRMVDEAKERREELEKKVIDLQCHDWEVVFGVSKSKAEGYGQNRGFLTSVTVTAENLKELPTILAEHPLTEIVVLREEKRFEFSVIRQQSRGLVRWSVNYRGVGWTMNGVTTLKNEPEDGVEKWIYSRQELLENVEKWIREVVEPKALEDHTDMEEG